MTWEKYRLKYLCTDIIDCINKTAPISPVPTPYKMLRTSDIRNGKIDLSNLNCVSQEVFEKWTRRGKLQAGDIIFTREAPLGEVGLVRIAKNYFLGQRLVLFRADNSICYNKFLLYSILFRDNKQSIISKGNGATVLHLRVPECENIEIPLPPLPVQHRIADILSAYDDLIEVNQKQIRLLEEAARRLYREWFVDLRFPGHEDTPITDGIPAGWNKTHISEICQMVSGGTPSTKVESYYSNGSIPWVTPTDITQNKALFFLDTEKKITEDGLHHSSAKMVPAGTILMTSRASVGYFGMCDFEVCTNQGFISCIPNQSNLQMFLLFNLKNRIGEIRQKAGGSTYLEIRKTTLGTFDILIPSAPILQLFQNITQSIFQKERSLLKTNKLLQEARDRLLPKLMNGEIEV